jgi:hypothetical protein
MTLLLSNPLSANCASKFKFSDRIQELITRYLSQSHLEDRLQDLPHQFDRPKPRKWALIDWQKMNIDQIVAIEPQLFLAILKGAIDTEAPIRDYTQTSRQYLAPIHPQMAKFVGGTVDEMGKVKSKGLWELEERRHNPALTTIYRQLGGDKITPTHHQARAYQPTDCADRDLYRHGLHRILTEYGATCLYLWLMGHSTGTLQQVLGELVEDEVNHLTKFWGFGIWLYPLPRGCRLIHNCRQLLPRQSSGNLLKTYQRMLSVLQWHQWTWRHQGELIWTFYLVIKQLLKWHHSLNLKDLDRLLGRSWDKQSTD